MRIRGPWSGVAVVVVATSSAVLLLAPTAAAKAPKDCGLPQIATNGTIGPVVCRDGSPSLIAGKIMKMSAPRVMALTRSSSWVDVREAVCDDILNTHATLPMAVDAYAFQYVRLDWRGSRPLPGTVHFRLAMGGVC